VSLAPPPDRGGVLLRLGLFILLAWLGRVIFPVPLLIFGDVLAATVGIFAAGAVANAIVVRVYEAGHLSDVGLGWSRGSWRELWAGAALGAGAGSAVLGAALLAGWAHFAPAEGSAHPWVSVPFLATLLLFGAMGEEMLFRGYAFQLLIRVAGVWPTIVPTSLLFGLAHLFNPHPSALGVANTALWGCVLGYAYWRTKALWLSIGLHFGWNLALPLFGENLSGLTMKVTGYALTWTVGELWSGGAYGVEASILTTLAAGALLAGLRRIGPGAAVVGGKE
jgi:membrane protease YdiL (CAAX protease family)